MKNTIPYGDPNTLYMSLSDRNKYHAIELEERDVKDMPFDEWLKWVDEHWDDED